MKYYSPNQLYEQQNMYAQVPILSSSKTKYNLNNNFIQHQDNYNENDTNPTLDLYTKKSTKATEEIFNSSGINNKGVDVKEFTGEINTIKNSRPVFKNIEISNNSIVNQDLQVNSNTSFSINLLNNDLNSSNKRLDIQDIPTNTPISSFQTKFPNNMANINFISQSPQRKNFSKLQSDQKVQEIQNNDSLSKNFEKLNINYQNMSLPPPPNISLKESFSDDSNFEKESPNILRELKDNKEKLQINASLKMNLPNTSNLKSPISNLNSQINDKISQDDFQKTKLTNNQLNKEISSNINNVKSSSKLPPKLPSNINANNSFKRNIEHNIQFIQKQPESISKVENKIKDSTFNSKEMIRPPTAPTFYISNSNLTMNNRNIDLNAEKNISSKYNSDDMIHMNMGVSKNIKDSDSSNLFRPPTAPNSAIKLNNLPKVDLLMSLMDKTVESKRREFEKLNKLKYALSELGNFNKRLLEENNRLKSGNSNSNIQDQLSTELSLKNSKNSSEDLKMVNECSDVSIAENPYISSQLNSLKAIINKKNQKILDLEKKMSQCTNNKDSSVSMNEPYFLLIEKLKIREENLSRTLCDIENSCSNSVSNAGNLLSLVKERNYERLKTISNDILNQIEFNYRALTVTLEHLIEQQNSTLESIKNENNIGSHIENSQDHKIHLKNNIEFNLSSDLALNANTNSKDSLNQNLNLDFNVTQQQVCNDSKTNVELNRQADLNFKEYRSNLDSEGQINLNAQSQEDCFHTQLNSVFKEKNVQNNNIEITEHEIETQEYFNYKNNSFYNNPVENNISLGTQMHFFDPNTKQGNESINCLSKNKIGNYGQQGGGSTNESNEQIYNDQMFNVVRASDYSQDNAHSLNNYLTKDISNKNLFINDKSLRKSKDEYEEDIPPPVLAAYTQESSENSKLPVNFTMNGGETLYENSTYYQVPQNIINI